MRPIDADKFKSHLEKAMEKMHLIHGVAGVDVGAVIKALEMQTTLDVVPRSEVEALQGALKAEERHNELTMKMAQKALKNAKTEVAREIFECLEPSFAIGEFTGSDVFFSIRAEDYNRCKNKYKEDGK